MSTKTSLPVNAEPRAFFFDPFTTIGSIVVGGKLIIDQLNGAIDKAGDEIRDLLKEVKADIESLIKDIEKTYQNNLDITLDNLDTFTRGQIESLKSMFRDINTDIKEDLSDLNENLKERIDELIKGLLSTVKSLENMLNRTIIRAGKAVVYVFNQVLYRIVYVSLPIIAVILVGIALIVYPFVFKGGFPGGIGGFFVIFLMIALFCVSIALLVPKSRLWFIRRTGLLAEEKWESFDDRPRIMGIIPEVLKYTVTSELKIWGVNLLKDNVVPTVKINEITAKVKLDPEPTHELILLDVSQKSFKFVGESYNYYDVILYYGAEEGPHGTIEIQDPSKPLPDLIISNFQISPSQPTRTRKATATIEVSNQGKAKADGKFAVKWSPIVGDTTGFQQKTIDGLEPGQKKSVSFTTDTYQMAGEFETEVVVDPDGEIKEVNPENNTMKKKVKVLELPPDLEVRDFKVVPYPDDFGDGKIYKGYQVKCTFKIRNCGEGPVPATEDIEVYWEAGTDAGYKETSIIEGGMAVGEEKEISMTYKYKTEGGPFQSIAGVIPLQEEPNKDNNQKVLRIPVLNDADAPRPKVIIWSDVNRTGRSNTLPLGEYGDLKDVGAGWREDIDCIEIPEGLVVEAWNGLQFDGTKHYGPYRGPLYIPRVYGQNQWLSMKIKRTDEVGPFVEIFAYPNFDYTNKCATIFEGEVSDLANYNNDGWSNDIDSIIIPAGLKVTAWSYPNFKETQYGPYKGPKRIDKVQGQGDWDSIRVEKS